LSDLIKETFIYKMVINDDISFPQTMETLDRDKSGVTGSSPH